MKNAPDESALVIHARRELQLAGLYDKDGDYNGALGPSILRVVEAFAAEQYSGASGAVAAITLYSLLRFQPITPLTYQPDEWNDVSGINGTPLWQNRRDSQVFSIDGGATWYHLDGRRGPGYVPSP
jgi:hypothetical protein